MADLTITAAEVLEVSGAIKRTEDASATITAGQPVYLNSSTKWALCDADSAALADCDGISLHAALENQPLTVQSGGIIDPGATLTVGQVYAVSTNVGRIGLYSDLGSGDFVTVLGVATTVAHLPLNIINSGIAKP